MLYVCKENQCKRCNSRATTTKQSNITRIILLLCIEMELFWPYFCVGAFTFYSGRQKY